ncbi:MAG: site-specific DNA-methyltransferase [Candidatus Paceibacterota bacterium]|jgi:adenine-specific DNA-methyltransferase
MKKEIELQSKKPKLAYIGMDKKTVVEAVPTQVVEIIYPSKAQKSDENTLFAKGQLQTKIAKPNDLPKNRLIWTSDNLVALKTLLDEKDSVSGEYKYRNKIDLIYIDPPFMVQNDFITENSIDIEVDEKEGVMSVKEPTIIETIAYKDTWQNGLDSFLQMMRERLELMKDLLSPTGSIYVHLDWHAIHYVKVLMDEIFDYTSFSNTIIWRKTNSPKAQTGGFGNQHDAILFYKFSKNINPIFKEFNEKTLEPYRYDDNDGRGSYRLIEIEAQGTQRNAGRKTFKFHGVIAPWLYKIETLEGWWNDGRIYTSSTGRYSKKQYLNEMEGVLVSDIWVDKEVAPLQGGSQESTPYPTQKPIGLLKRIITASCPRGGIVLDAFTGSGTTCEAAERLAEELKCTWVGIDNSKFAIHTARKRLIELSSKLKEKKGEGVYRVRPFTVENMGYYQRGVKWDPIQVGKQADAYRQAIVELFGGEYASYSKLLHGKKKGTWIHVGPLSTPIIGEQLYAIAEEVKETEFKKCYVLSADFTAHNQSDVEKIKKELGIQIMVRLIPASAIEEVRKRLNMIKQGVKDQENISEMPNIAFFAPLTIKINKTTEGKEVAVELSGLEVDVESFLDSQKPEQREKLKKWLDSEKSWKSFVDFWAIDWDYEDFKGKSNKPIFENEWQSFRKKKGNKMTEDLVFKGFHNYEKKGEYTIAVKVTDVFGNDGIVTTKVVIK